MTLQLTYPSYEMVLLHLRSFFFILFALIIHIREYIWCICAQFCYTFACTYSQPFLCQLLVFNKVLTLLPLFPDLVISLFGLSQGSATVFCLHVSFNGSVVLFFYVVMIEPSSKNHGIFEISSASCLQVSFAHFHIYRF